MAKNKNKKKVDWLQIIGYLAIIVIIISLITIGIKLTGFVGLTDTGTVNVSVNSQTSINFTYNNINFGSGQVNVSGGFTSVTLESNGTSPNTAGSGNWSWTASNFTVDNIGNTNVYLNLKTGKTNSTFIGGTNPGYKYAVINAKADSCGTPGVTVGGWYNVNYNSSGVNTTATGPVICNNFTSATASNRIAIYVQLTISQDSSTGALGDVFTATATAN